MTYEESIRNDIGIIFMKMLIFFKHQLYAMVIQQ
jgi:hypothetical protein